MLNFYATWVKYNQFRVDYEPDSANIKPWTLITPHFTFSFTTSQGEFGNKQNTASLKTLTYCVYINIYFKL